VISLLLVIGFTTLAALHSTHDFRAASNLQAMPPPVDTPSAAATGTEKEKLSFFHRSASRLSTSFRSRSRNHGRSKSPTTTLPPRALSTPTTVLETLLAANVVYASGESPPPVPAPLASVRAGLAANGQAPQTTIIACADSRVSPELLFRATLGELFVIRTAGNVTDDPAVLASLEYAVAHLSTPLVIVLGHDGCGAVKAAIDYNADPAGVGAALSPTSHLCRHVEKLAATVGTKGEATRPDLRSAVELNVRAAVTSLRAASPALARAESDSSVHIKAAVYDIESGLVRVISGDA
jgi:carbonic anhydrase